MRIEELCNKESRLVIGLMSGTSADGIDASLCRISGTGATVKCDEIAFYTEEYSPEIREKILSAASGENGGSRELLMLSFLLGDIFLETCIKLCRKAGVSKNEIDLIGSHGQTVFHIPTCVDYCGRKVRGTMQIGDVSAMAEYFHCPVVSDFRVRDFAAGGMGAPLVPYTEFLLYKDHENDTAYQNIGGIGNITIIRKGSKPEGVVAFDTGPGNMILDALMSHYTDYQKKYDGNGNFAREGKPSPILQSWFMEDKYYQKRYPKTTGREYYNNAYIGKILEIANENGIDPHDVVNTAAWFTAESIRKGIADMESIYIKKLTVAGGGSHNTVIMGYLKEMLPEIQVITGEERGFNSDSKEAVAFALLANETVHGTPNVISGATGATHPTVLGKIQF